MNRVIIIAEAGVNHNGNIKTSKQMVDVAKNAGADYIKFQTFVPQNVVSKYAEKAEYQKKNSGNKESQLQMLNNLALSSDDFIELKKYCDKVGIGFISTPFDIDSITFLETLDMDFWKIPSGEITNLPYLEAIGKTGKKVVMSTGMSTICEIKESIGILEKYNVPEIIILHCNTQYPTPFEDANLKAINTLAEETCKAVGYSDHTIGIEASIAAVAMGARIIEKHFTLDKSMDGPDHRASLNPNELKSMISSIRNIEKSFGDGKKKPSPSEVKNIIATRKSIVASKIIRKGETFSTENLGVKRPGNGISPMLWYKVLGTTAKRDFQEDELIEI